MHRTQLHLAVCQPLAEFLDAGPLRDAFEGIAHLAEAELLLDRFDPGGTALCPNPHRSAELLVRQAGQAVGRLTCPGASGSEAVGRAGRLLVALTEHLAQREAAVTDLARELLGAYSELNLLYSLMPSIATKTNLDEIAELLVGETARALRSGRVSLLMLDDKQETFTLLASRGLPGELRGLSIPVSGSIAGQVMHENGLMVVQDILDCPDLANRSRGAYDSRSFAVIRMPLRAQGRALGVLTVTEREGSPDFSAQDRKLLEALSAMGASALMNCRLHAALTGQILGTIQALASVVDAKDHYTHDHSRRVADLCVATAHELGIEREASDREIELAGLLHDIGKIGIPDHILTKKQRLTDEEFAIVRTHVQIGARIVERVAGLERVAKAILHHHERYDGVGYPAGLSGDEIPVGSKLIAVADAFDSLTSERPYRKAVSEADALRELGRCQGSQFDPEVFEAFARVIAREKADRSRTPRPPPRAGV